MSGFLQGKRRLASITILALVSGLLWTTPAQSAGEGADPPNQIMVESYAESFDVSRDVASAALRFQDEMLPMIDDLAERWPDVFSNARFVNGREYALIIALAGPGPDIPGVAADVAETARAHARSQGHEESRVSIETAPLSLNQINRASELVSKNLEGVEHEASFSHETGRFTIRSESPTVVAERLAPGKVDLPVDVVDEPPSRSYVEANCETVTDGWLEAGRLLRMHHEADTFECGATDHEHCTTGFAVRRNGVEGALTAGHCLGWNEPTNWWSTIMYANGTADFTATRLLIQSAENSAIADAQINREVWSSSAIKPRIYLHGQNWLTIKSFVHQHPNDMYVCVKGAQTALESSHNSAVMCGTIVNNVAGGLIGKQANAWAEVHLTERPWARSGDSGGPVWQGTTSNTALGLLTHTSGSPSDHMLYNKIGFVLAELDATLATG